MTYTLAQLPPGESGCVAALDFPPRKARRMEDLGFLPGQQVTALHTPPFGGITAYQGDGPVLYVSSIAATTKPANEMVSF